MALHVPFVDVVAGIGVVVGAVLGAWFAPRAATTDEPLMLAFRLSVLAMPAGGAIFGLAVSATTAPVLVLLTTAFAPVLYPLLAPVVYPITLAAILAGRRLLRAAPMTASVVLAALLAGDVTGLVIAPAVADWLSPTVVSPSGDLLRRGPHWFTRLTAARRVEVTVLNGSDEPAQIELSWPIGGGFQSGAQELAPACFAMGTTMLAENGWQLHARTDPWGGTVGRDDPALIADASNFAGDAALVLTIDRDGSIVSRPGSLSDSDLGPMDGCAPAG
jgi:hypothetical protein